MIGMFVCVFSEHDRDIMQAAGFMLLNSDDVNKIYTFENNQEKMSEHFSFDEIQCVYTDTLTL